MYKLVKLLVELRIISTDFYGEVRIVFKKGTVIKVEKTESISLKEIEAPGGSEISSLNP